MAFSCGGWHRVYKLCGLHIPLTAWFLQVEQCVKTIHRMFENIVNFSGEEKYRRVKMEGRAFQDKIKDIEGGLELLLAAGFEEREEVSAAGVTEKFLVFPEERLGEIEQLRVSRI
jgi:hypothetical protein